MRKEFTKQDLLTGDIVVTRGGELGVVLAEKDYILYQNDGLDFFDMFTEELLSEDEETNWDIKKNVNWSIKKDYWQNTITY